MRHLNLALAKGCCLVVFFDPADSSWIALAAPSMDDAAWASAILTGELGPATDLATYFVVGGRHHPVSTGLQSSASAAIDSVNHRLATVRNWNLWHERLVRAYAVLRSEDLAAMRSTAFINEAHDARRLVAVEG